MAFGFLKKAVNLVGKPVAGLFGDREKQKISANTWNQAEEIIGPDTLKYGGPTGLDPHAMSGVQTRYDYAAGQADNLGTQAGILRDVGTQLADESKGELSRTNTATNDLVGRLQRTEAGLTPSVAETMLARTTGDNLREQLALASGARGNMGGALRQAARNSAVIQGNAARDAALLRANETATAREQLGTVLANKASSNLSGVNLGQNQQAFYSDKQQELGPEFGLTIGGAELAKAGAEYNARAGAESAKLGAEEARTNLIKDVMTGRTQQEQSIAAGKRKAIGAAFKEISKLAKGPAGAAAPAK